ASAGAAGRRPAQRALQLPRHGRGGRADRLAARVAGSAAAAAAGAGGGGRRARRPVADAGGGTGARPGPAAGTGRTTGGGAVTGRMPGHRQRGAALLLVLWLIVRLTALVGAFALSARVEQIQGRVLYRGIVGDQAARAGLEYALLRLADADPQARWVPDGRSYEWDFNGIPVRVQVVDESGKVDLNAADQPLLASLMAVLGADQPQAEALAAAIADWRDPDDLGQVAGMAEDPQYAAAGLPY